MRDRSPPQQAEQQRGGAPAVAPRPHVVVVGCGFGGLYAARDLRRLPVRLTLIDRRNHHLFQPLLYQVATAALTDADVAEPIRKIFRRDENVSVMLGEVVDLDPEARQLVLRDGERVAYDYAVIATGARHNYFGHDEWETLAPGLKTIEDAYEIRRRVLLAFERAERARDAAFRSLCLTFVVVGAGPTGVELAGALREIAQRTLASDFRSFDPRDTRVVLVDAVDRVLPGFPPDLSERTRAMLEARGVEVRTGTLVKDLREDAVVVEGGEIPAGTVLWAAGNRASRLLPATGAPLDRQGRAEVEPDLSVPGHPELFVIGDAAQVRRENGDLVPGLAPAAIQEGRFVARTIRRELDGRPRGRFRYKDRGLLATVGRRAAVLAMGRLHMAGFLAWILWLVVHLAWLIGFRNRLVVLIEWTVAYFSHQRSARVILHREPEKVPSPATRGAGVGDLRAAAAPSPEAAAARAAAREGAPDG